MSNFARFIFLMYKYHIFLDERYYEDSIIA